DQLGHRLDAGGVVDLLLDEVALRGEQARTDRPGDQARDEPDQQRVGPRELRLGETREQLPGEQVRRQAERAAQHHRPPQVGHVDDVAPDLGELLAPPAHVAPPVRSSARTRSAWSTRTFRSATSRATTAGSSSAVAPTVVAMLRACSDMWPRWMPSVASARTAAKFCASPTAVMISASSAAVPTPSSATAACAAGCTVVAPPTRPTGIGSSSVPTRSPAASFSNRESGAQGPSAEAARE